MELNGCSLYADIVNGKVDVTTKAKTVDGVYSFEVPEEGQVLVVAEFEEIVVEPEEKEESNVPQTGDKNPVGTYVVVMLAAMVCGLAAYKKIRRV